MIVDFACKETELVWRGAFSRKLPQDIQKTALRKLRMLNNVKRLDDLKVPPNNRLEALKHDRTGQHSIRINDQWRICFVWTEGGPNHVEIIDYH
ncbi:Plasmid maintenance system killer [Magnetospirillum molischianum DSM 120]|uniref:Plasmid maintenance system killer n=1 Tax=Magnetospirillum molischianum DSM 120 TaxID=1150626 RepID=H8FTM4_MAGML|nr:Plasmid maintenance system killer [Magnetospirillum molischianum DSM 120]